MGLNKNMQWPTLLIRILNHTWYIGIPSTSWHKPLISGLLGYLRMLCKSYPWFSHKLYLVVLCLLKLWISLVFFRIFSTFLFVKVYFRIWLYKDFPDYLGFPVLVVYLLGTDFFDFSAWLYMSFWILIIILAF